MDLLQSSKLSSEQVKKFMSIHGVRGSKTMELAGKFGAFQTALTSEIGRELLHDVMVKMEILLEAIIQENPPKGLSMEQCKAEYRVLRDILNRWSEKISKYHLAINKIKEA